MPLLHFIGKRFELLFWIAALIILYFLPVNEQGQSLCLSTLLGLGSCPGCGIGHAIHHALHFKFADSFHHHPMGIFAVIIIFIRIKQLIYPLKKFNETQSR